VLQSLWAAVTKGWQNALSEKKLIYALNEFLNYWAK
jgi:hypothetical protein